MGSRGVASMSGSGNKQKEIDENIEKNGHVSLNISDYEGFSGSEVRNFFAEQDYEVAALFNDKDEIIDIQSQFKEEHVVVSRSRQSQAMKQDGGTNFKDFHNHPMNKHTIQIFSPKDIEGYVNDVTGGEISKIKLKKEFPNLNLATSRSKSDVCATTFMVQTQNGSKFTLGYTGNKTSKNTKTVNFYTAYARAFNRNTKKFSPDTVTQNMVKWLQVNAPKYGFEVSEASFKPFK